ncbi:uncharacterized protein A1O5_08435 [Cladophialophora psammophila CBS 110553]|uniref:Transcription factor domain-containing protein n=1 Tax=Cladophialophora psammophila CBS 110553 TaxID=1182543 RepID=W9WVF9_9EURO|nr:uncharacterized protein A1O5_08435 [Cladophialophora psammophila CBS 110553]EXJ68641.1 hypothetical protein A1O5_08435 [Cladophialophora psammophila CBS 110553]
MSAEPGARARIQPELRASAKAHVMHDYQRKTAQQRSVQWKMSTPTTYALAPKEPVPGFPCPESAVQPLVMRERMVVRKKESQPKRKPKAAATELPSSNDSSQSSQQALASTMSDSAAYSQFIHYDPPAIPRQPRGSSLMDVFSALPIEVQPWDETLITRWLNYDRIPWCPVNGQSQWVPFVTNSPMLLHTNLYSWGMHWHGKLTGVNQEVFLYQNSRILEHKIAAIQMINAHLVSQAPVTDETLAAVSMFINVSMQFLNRDEAAKHMAGLEALVKLRGGLEGLTRMGTVGVLLQRIITWNDLFFVELFGGNLRFALLPRWDEAWKFVYAPIADDPVTHLEPLQARFAGDLAKEITTLLREIQIVCNDVQARPLQTLSTAERTLRHDNLFRFERRLCLATRITTIQEHVYTDLQGGNDPMWRTVAYAALMYVHHHIRGHALHWSQFPALVVQLRNELSFVQPSSWDAVPALHLWVHAVASWVSLCEEWVVTQLADACRARGCKSWDDFDGTLKRCVHIGRRDEQKFRIVWEAVAKLV